MGNRDRSGHTGVDSKIPLFHKPLETLEVPVPLMGSLEDNMRRKNLAEEYQQMSQQIPDCKIHLFFKQGDLPQSERMRKAPQRLLQIF